MPYDNLVQFEEDFNSRTEKWRWGPVGIGYVRPVQFLDHLTVIKKQSLFDKWETRVRPVLNKRKS